MWSMWIMTLEKWNIKKFEKKDVYAYEWNLKRALYDKLKAPEWLDKITDSFGLRDANYFINTRDSSRAIKFFIEKAGYKTYTDFKFALDIAASEFFEDGKYNLRR